VDFAYKRHKNRASPRDWTGLSICCSHEISVREPLELSHVRGQTWPYLSTYTGRLHQPFLSIFLFPSHKAGIEDRNQFRSPSATFFYCLQYSIAISISNQSCLKRADANRVPFRPLNDKRQALIQGAHLTPICKKNIWNWREHLKLEKIFEIDREFYVKNPARAQILDPPLHGLVLGTFLGIPRTIFTPSSPLIMMRLWSPFKHCKQLTNPLPDTRHLCT
jgi:hypothetical protein